jgi:hypothetical protein
MKPSRMVQPSDYEDCIFIPPSEIEEDVEEFYQVDDEDDEWQE